ncbi:hypothetical protein OBBRIDRAFT_419513 [Obba rivulosa]|uniref:Ribonuclease H1 N-terminal domain-containing protein n=1 Tax=Obba rivulosa TaxID=1052685 RepID=A0A8E2AXG0_9APHY|nr:hypothetical protein OBBRIDRAFT_419513 [Obba rivulosa]
MVRALIMKFYAVKLGRQGPQIYPSWEEAKKHVSGFPGAVHKSFTNRRKAEEWLMSGTPVNERLETSMNSLKISTPITNTPSRDQSPQLQEDAPEIVMVPEPANVTETAPLLGTSPPQGAPIILSPEQETVLRMVQRGQSVFFTGSAEHRHRKVCTSTRDHQVLWWP